MSSPDRHFGEVEENIAQFIQQLRKGQPKTVPQTGSSHPLQDAEENIQWSLILAREQKVQDHERIALVTGLTEQIKGYYEKYIKAYDHHKRDETEIASVSQKLITAAKKNTIADIDILLYPNSTLENEGGYLKQILTYGKNSIRIAHPDEEKYRQQGISLAPLKVVQPTLAEDLFVIHAQEPSILITRGDYVIPAEKYRLVGKNNLPKYAPELFK